MKNQGKDGEKRGFFRVDDVIPVVANPVSFTNEADKKVIKDTATSQAFPLFDLETEQERIDEERFPEGSGDSRMYEMLKEMKAKLDFLINHLLVEKEGLLSTEKKMVNISASGVRFTVKQPVSEKDVMEIKLLLPTYPPVAVFAYGEVKRVKKLDDDTYEVALEYLNMGESVKNKIIQYTLDHQREYIRKIKESGK